MNFFIFYIASVAVSYLFLNILAQKTSERLDNMDYFPEEENQEPSTLQLSIGNIIMFIPFINLIMVIFGCIKSEDIIQMTIKDITGQDEDDDEKNSKN